LIKNKIQALFNAEQYHGWGKTSKYFEGWYYKVINAKEDKAFAFIPGIAMDKNGEQQAFIQVLDGKKLTAIYHKFDARDGTRRILWALFLLFPLCNVTTAF